MSFILMLIFVLGGLLLKVSFWTLAFVDYAVLTILTWIFTQELGFHPVLSIMSILAVIGVWVLLSNLPLIEFLLPVLVLSLVSFFLTREIVAAYNLDALWQIFINVVMALVLIKGRLSVTGKTDKLGQMIERVG